jgi:glycosyltransferase involved in cell wall biosynthesis
MANINIEYDLIVVGDGEFKKECLILVNELNLNTRVHFLGSCLSNEAPYYYKNSDIFVLPTRFRLDANVQMESWVLTALLTILMYPATSVLLSDAMPTALIKESS